MPTSKQRREAQRRHLERQLQRRQERDARRKRTTLIASIAGTVVLIAVIVVLVVVVSGNDSTTKTNDALASVPSGAASSPGSSGSASPAASPSSSPARPATGPSVSFEGVTVKGATDLGGAPGVTAKSATAPTKLLYKDLVVGKGKPADPKSTVTVQYTGVLYKDGTQFDSSWKRGEPAQFPLTGVVPGFTQGIGGGDGVPPMKVGGRRIMILPASLGYGAQPNAGIPANSPLVFVVDLKSIDG